MQKKIEVFNGTVIVTKETDRRYRMTFVATQGWEHGYHQQHIDHNPSMEEIKNFAKIQKN